MNTINKNEIILLGDFTDAKIGKMNLEGIKNNYKKVSKKLGGYVEYADCERRNIENIEEFNKWKVIEEKLQQRSILLMKRKGLLRK